MSKVSRRKFLSTSAALIASSLSGCEAFQSPLKWTTELTSPIASALLGTYVVAVSQRKVRFIRTEDGEKAGSLDIQVNPRIDTFESTGYAGTEKGVAAFDADGVIWEEEVDGLRFPEVCASQGIILAAGSQKIVAIDREGGQVSWRSQLPRKVTGQPEYGSETMFVPLNQGIYAVDNEGSEAWQTAVDGSTTLALGSSTVYVVGESAVHALSREDGKEYWAQNGWVQGPPVLDRGLVFTGGSRLGVYAIDRQSGQPVWAYPDDGDETDNVTPPVIAGDSAVFAKDSDGSDMLFSVQAKSGSENWTHELTHPQRFPPVAANNLVFVGDETGLHAFSS